MALLDRNRSLWMGTTPTTTFPHLVGTHDTDVVVVGAGITGLTTALLLAQRGRSVAVVEAHAVAAGTTGSTTAKITSLHSLTYAKLVDQIGSDGARSYGQANEAAVAKIADLVDELAIDCAFTRAPAFTYTLQPDRRSTIEAEVAAAQGLGLPATYTEETDLPYPVAGAIRFDGQAHFHPRRYGLGLASALDAAGVSIFEGSRATDIDEGPDGVVVTTAHGQVRARTAVVATLLPFLDIGGYFAKAHPTRSYALSARCRGAVPAGMYLSIDEPSRSIRPVDLDGWHGLVLGGGGHKPGDTDDPARFYDDLERWTMDTFDVEEIDHRWSAQDYTTIDDVPYIGRCARTERVFVATGYKKWGMTGGTVAGMLIADLVTGVENPWLGVFDATRVGPQGVGTFVKENASVGVHFVKDRLARLAAGHVEDLAPGDGGVVWADSHAVGAYRDPAGQVHAVSITCTHLGCTLAWNGAETSWDCPCHGSRFTPSGAVIEGPATQPLEQVTMAEEVG